MKRKLGLLLALCMSFSINTKVFAKDSNLSFMYGGTSYQYKNYLDRTDNVLNYISPDYFKISPDGSLILNDNFDENFIEEAHSKGLKVIPYVSNNRDRNLGKTALRNKGLLSLEISNMLQDRNLDGIIVDLNNLTFENKEDYITFLKSLKNNIGSKLLNVAVEANPTNSNVGTFSFYDYEKIGQIADNVILMCFDESSSSTKPAPVSSKDYVEESVKNLIEKIPSDKVLLGVSFYGRYWKNGENNISNPITNLDINSLLENYSSIKEFDEDSQNYKAIVTISEKDLLPKLWGGNTLTKGDYEIWYENADALKNKQNLVEKYNLNGIATWSLGQEDTAIWDKFKDENFRVVGEKNPSVEKFEDDEEILQVIYDFSQNLNEDNDLSAESKSITWSTEEDENGLTKEIITIETIEDEENMSNNSVPENYPNNTELKPETFPNINSENYPNNNMIIPNENVEMETFPNNDPIEKNPKIINDKNNLFEPNKRNYIPSETSYDPMYNTDDFLPENNINPKMNKSNFDNINNDPNMNNNFNNTNTDPNMNNNNFDNINNDPNMNNNNFDNTNTDPNMNNNFDNTNTDPNLNNNNPDNINYDQYGYPINNDNTPINTSDSTNTNILGTDDTFKNIEKIIVTESNISYDDSFIATFMFDDVEDDNIDDQKNRLSNPNDKNQLPSENIVPPIGNPNENIVPPVGNPNENIVPPIGNLNENAVPPIGNPNENIVPPVGNVEQNSVPSSLMDKGAPKNNENLQTPIPAENNIKNTKPAPIDKTDNNIMPLPADNDINNIMPLPADNDINNIMPLPANNDKNNIMPLPANNDINNIMPLPADNDKNNIMPLPANNDINNIMPLPANNDKNNIMPLPANNDKNNIMPLPANNDKNNIMPLPANNDKNNIMPLPANNDINNIMPLPANNDKNNIMPLPADNITPRVFMPSGFDEKSTNITGDKITNNNSGLIIAQKYIYDKGYFSENEFYNNLFITRGQAISSLMKMSDDLEYTSTDDFISYEDIGNSPYKVYIEKAKFYGVIDGETSVFMPEDYITKKDFVMMIDRLFDLTNAVNFNSDKINDVSKSNNQELYYTLNKLYELGIIKLDSNQNFYPNNDLSREDFVEILYNLKDAKVKQLQKYAFASELLFDRIFQVR